MNPATQQYSSRVAVLAPYVVQLMAMLLAGLYVILHDGTQTQNVMQTLEVIALGNVAGGIVGAVSGHYAAASIARANASASAAASNANASVGVISAANGTNGPAPAGAPDGQVSG